MTPTSLKIIRDTLSDYCQDKILRVEADRILRMAGLSQRGISDILDAADANLTLKRAYRSAS